MFNSPIRLFPVFDFNNLILGSMNIASLGSLTIVFYFGKR